MRNLYDYSLSTGETKAALHLHNMGDDSNIWYFFPLSHPCFLPAWEQILSAAFSLKDDSPQKFSLTLSDGSRYHVPQDKANAVLDALADALEQNPDQVQKTEYQKQPFPFAKPVSGQPGTGMWSMEDLRRFEHQLDMVNPQVTVICACCGRGGAFMDRLGRICKNCGAPFPKDGLRESMVPLTASSPDQIMQHIRLNASPQAPDASQKTQAASEDAWDCTCGAEAQTASCCAECGMEKSAMPKPNRKASTQQNTQEGQRKMADIRIVTCGQFTMYLPDGSERPSEIIQLQVWNDQGAMLVTSGRPLTVAPDSPHLAKALSAIEALLAEHPDCPCERRPFLNEIFRKDGSYCFAPRQALMEILMDLYRNTPNPAAEKLAATLHPAGLVQAEVPPEPTPAPIRQIERIRVNTDEIRYYLKTLDDGRIQLDMITPDKSIERYQFQADHPAFLAAAEKIRALPLTEKDASKEEHEIRYADSEPSYADKDALWSIMDDLRFQLDENMENVHYESHPGQPQFAGAFVCPPTHQNIPTIANSGMATSGLMEIMQKLQQPAPQPAPSPKPTTSSVLHSDGTWDCGCGAKGLTTKFCIDCSAKKPEPWKCGCGKENTGKFCENCGAMKPKPWRCGCGTENTGKFCINCGGNRPET